MSCAFSECRELFAASPGTGVEMHENWLEATRYLNMDHLKEHKKEALRLVRLTAARRERRCPTRRLCAWCWPAGKRRVSALPIWQQHPISPCLAVTEVMRRQLPVIAR